MISEPEVRSAGTDRLSPRMVVGVDGSDSSMRALEWAAAEAELRGLSLLIVHVAFARREALESLAPGMLPAEQSLLDRAVAKAKALSPGTAVTGRICEPPTAKALISESEGAEMLVVGSRGLSGLDVLALGSVSSECARRATCSVVVIRPPDRRSSSGAAGRGGASTPAHPTAESG